MNGWYIVFWCTWFVFSPVLSCLLCLSPLDPLAGLTYSASCQCLCFRFPDCLMHILDFSWWFKLCSCLHAFTAYLWGTYCVPGSGLGIGDTVMRKTVSLGSGSLDLKQKEFPQRFCLVIDTSSLTLVPLPAAGQQTQQQPAWEPPHRGSHQMWHKGAGCRSKKWEMSLSAANLPEGCRDALAVPRTGFVSWEEAARAVPLL